VIHTYKCLLSLQSYCSSLRTKDKNVYNKIFNDIFYYSSEIYNGTYQILTHTHNTRENSIFIKLYLTVGKYTYIFTSTDSTYCIYILLLSFIKFKKHNMLLNTRYHIIMDIRMQLFIQRPRSMMIPCCFDKLV